MKPTNTNGKMSTSTKSNWKKLIVFQNKGVRIELEADMVWGASEYPGGTMIHMKRGCDYIVPNDYVEVVEKIELSRASGLRVREGDNNEN